MGLFEKLVDQIKIPQFERYEIGTVSLFIGLSFFTLVPLIMRFILVFVSPNIYRAFGASFLVLATIFYIFSPDYYRKQLMALGLSFIIFSMFQFFSSLYPVNLSDFSNYLALFLGIFLLGLGTYLEKKAVKD